MFTRYRNFTLLGLLILGQLLLLAYQIRRPNAGGVRLLRMWTISAILPLAQASHVAVGGTRQAVRNYVDLRRVRQRNIALEAQLQQLELENVRLRESAREAVDMASLLGFKVRGVKRFLPAQVVGSSLSADSEVLYINRGAAAGVALNMPVMTPTGVVGKITQVLHGSAEVLVISDPDSGVGAMLAGNQVHGILWGLGSDRLELRFVSNSEKVATGSEVVTSGEDQIFPPGWLLGRVISARTDRVFQSIAVQPAVDVARVDNVLVAIDMGPFAAPVPSETPGATEAEIRAKHLPAIPHETFNPLTGAPPTVDDLLAARRAAARQAAGDPHTTSSADTLPPTHAHAPAPAAAPVAQRADSSVAAGLAAVPGGVKSAGPVKPAAPSKKPQPQASGSGAAPGQR